MRISRFNPLNTSPVIRSSERGRSMGTSMRVAMRPGRADMT
ncbi:Uncharacterised protein [Bordetella pertussis]|nr:Uncharacterised protein [Bordetella pertussis]